MKNEPVSFYVHIPFCLSKCRYCDFFSVECKDKCSVPDEYVEALCKEIQVRLILQDKPELKSIYIGGGTPSLLSKSQLELIFNCFKQYSTFSSNIEITIEVNPDDVTCEFLDFVSKTPVNRISCGIQSMKDEVLKVCGRRADKKQNQQAIELLSQHWNGRLSLDLISGLPLESQDSFEEALEMVLASTAEHVSVYSLVVEEETPLGNLIVSNKIEYDYELSDDMWLKSREILEKSGFEQYEVSNFCKKNCQSIHNLTYWNQESYLGAGAGATGTVYHAGKNAFRFTSINDIRKYCDFWRSVKMEDFLDSDEGQNLEKLSAVQIVEEIDLENLKFEFFMMGLRKLSGVTNLEFKRRFNSDIPQAVVKQFLQWKEKSYCEIEEIPGKKGEISNIRYRLTKNGILFLNQFLSNMEF